MAKEILTVQTHALIEMDSHKKWFEDRIKEFENIIVKFLEENSQWKSTNFFTYFEEFKQHINLFNKQSHNYFGKVLDNLKSRRIHIGIEKQRSKIELDMTSLFDAQESLRQMSLSLHSKLNFEKDPKNKVKLENLKKVLDNLREIIEVYKRDLNEFQEKNQTLNELSSNK